MVPFAYESVSVGCQGVGYDKAGAS
ncbi:MAG: hypothetical protein RL767_499, partial [Bacteroidota bacterium]